MLQEYVTIHPGVFFKHVTKSAKMEKIYINFFKFSSVNFWDFIFFLKQIIEDMISENRKKTKVSKIILKITGYKVWSTLHFLILSLSLSFS